MHPRLTAAIEHADHARLVLLSALDAIPVPLQEARPSEEAWSAAEVIEHLARVERGISKLHAMKVAELQAMPVIPREMVGAEPMNIEKFATVPDRGTRLDAPERTRPTGELSASEARTMLLEVRRAHLEQLRESDGLALSAVTHPHPYFGALDMYEWVYFIGSHELRHAEQLRDLAAHFTAA
jgi:DinB superfamily